MHGSNLSVIHKLENAEPLLTAERKSSGDAKSGSSCPTRQRSSGRARDSAAIAASGAEAVSPHQPRTELAE